jgi:hypothetical protein
MYMAAAVPLETDEYVVIKLLSLGSAVPQTLQTHTLYQRAGSKFEVHFLNGCDQDECEWDYTSTNEKKRNDFHFMREVLDLPFGEKKYGLKIEVKAPIGATADVCPYIKFRNTDEAPCMGAGYGGGGFPSVP